MRSAARHRDPAWRAPDDRNTRCIWVLARDPSPETRQRQRLFVRSLAKSWASMSTKASRASASLVWTPSICSPAADAETALAIATAAVDDLIREGVVYPTSLFIPVVGIAQMVTGDLDGAQRTVDRLRGMAEELHSDAAVADADQMAALVARCGGRSDLAAPFARSALTIYMQLGLRPLAVEALSSRRRLPRGPRQRLRGPAPSERGQRRSPQRRAGSALGVTRRAPARRTSRRHVPLSVTARPRSLRRARHSRSNRPSSSRCAAHGTRKRPSMGWASLSPTELEVVALVAEGKTNPEIASALTISARNREDARLPHPHEARSGEPGRDCSRARAARSVG